MRQVGADIVADGEGAKRVIEIEVRGANTEPAAETIARTIANSPLVKTALAGGDPNWGRILAAAGRAGVRFDPHEVDIHIAGMALCRRGIEVPFDESVAHRRMFAKVRADSSRSLRRPRVSANLDLRFHRRLRPHQRQLSHVSCRRHFRSFFARETTGLSDYRALEVGVRSKLHQPALAL